MREEVTGGPECVFEMPEVGNTAKKVERGVSLENQQKLLKYVPFIFKPFLVWKIAYQVHKTSCGCHPRSFRELTPVVNCRYPKEVGRQL